MEVLNPASGDVIASVPRGAASDVEHAVAAATQALPEWRDTPAGERAELLLAFADALKAHRDELADLESRNAGKPLPAAREEVDYSIDNLRFFAGAARSMPGLPPPASTWRPTRRCSAASRSASSARSRRGTTR